MSWRPINCGAHSTGAYINGSPISILKKNHTLSGRSYPLSGGNSRTRKIKPVKGLGSLSSSLSVKYQEDLQKKNKDALKLLITEEYPLDPDLKSKALSSVIAAESVLCCQNLELLEEKGFPNQRISSQNMSFNVRSDRRAGPRLHAPNAQQEWVPRNPTNAPPLNPTNAPPLNPPPPRYSLHSAGDGGNPNGTAADVRLLGKSSNQPRNNGVGDHVPVHRGNHNHGPRGYRYVSQSRDKEKEKSEVNEGKVVKDPNLPQLVQEIQEKLTNGTVECMICYDMVRRSAPIWSCSSCYSIFHLNCIKKWARAPTSVDLSADTTKGSNWRCPGCQHVQLTSSKDINYLCFCAKRIDPPTDYYLTPHSCGEPCGKPLERDVVGNEEDNCLCPHVCVLQCHPGPCPPCKAFAPPRLCPCGKKTITTRCSDRKPVLTCGQRCDKLLECGRHWCENLCHAGPCGSCQVVFDASCFCKKNAEVILCGDMAVKGEIDIDSGVFSCGSKCGNMLGCQNHPCSEICHPGPCEECSFLPEKITTCHCRKTALLEERKSCLDPIPVCSQVCDKFLPCRIHQCKETCHVGDCPPCAVSVTQKCRCGLTSRTTVCYRTREENFTCDKPCGRKKNCGRHRCSERCCPSSSNSSIAASSSSSSDPHFCTMPCEKKLRCGQHSCERLCHSRHCPPCLETIFTDLTCACGGTSIPPPLPCGTPPPSCQLPCSVPKLCGHPSSHSCHLGECPPCSVPVAKQCAGAHVVIRNIPCGSKDIRCNKLCGKTRCCGLHACTRTCHGPPCDANPNPNPNPNRRSSCGQVCEAPRRDCKHTCRVPCHPSAPCPDVRCDSTVTISCKCGRITASVPCGSGGANPNFALEASIVQKLPSPLEPLDSSGNNGNRVPLGQRKLLCDGECAKVERKRVLADAFDITTPNVDSLHLGENVSSSELIANLLRRDPKWVISVEERCKFLVLGKSRVNSSSVKVHVFSPMLQEEREAVRVIAGRWKLVVNVAGWEPKRFVVVHATAKSKPPSRVLRVVKGSLTVGTHALAFDPMVDMDPRHVVSFLELPREADISTLVLRFGGECELVWLNDKNALAVFSDPTRAATALRRLEHGSVYHGAVVVVVQDGGRTSNNVWGGGGGAAAMAAAASRENPWKKAVTQEPSRKEEEEDVWAVDWSHDSTPMYSLLAERETTPISSASGNRWTILDGGTSCSSSAVEVAESSDAAVEVAEDWEKAYE